MPEDLPVPDSRAAWIAPYPRLAVAGTRSPAVAAKIALPLGRFHTYFTAAYGHEALSACVRRDGQGGPAHLRAVPLAPATVNNRRASLTGFTAWVTAPAPTLFATSNPGRGVGELGLGPLEPRARTAEQVRALKSVCDRAAVRQHIAGRASTSGAVSGGRNLPPRRRSTLAGP